MTDRIVCRTVAELRAALADFPDDSVPISLHPPFDGVGLVRQESGAVLVAPPERFRPTWGERATAA